MLLGATPIQSSKSSPQLGTFDARPPIILDSDDQMALLSKDQNSFIRALLFSAVCSGEKKREICIHRDGKQRWTVRDGTSSMGGDGWPFPMETLLDRFRNLLGATGKENGGSFFLNLQPLAGSRAIGRCSLGYFVEGTISGLEGKAPVASSFKVQLKLKADKRALLPKRPERTSAREQFGAKLDGGMFSEIEKISAQEIVLRGYRGPAMSHPLNFTTQRAAEGYAAAYFAGKGEAKLTDATGGGSVTYSVLVNSERVMDVILPPERDELRIVFSGATLQVADQIWNELKSDQRRADNELCSFRYSRA